MLCSRCHVRPAGTYGKCGPCNGAMIKQRVRETSIVRAIRESWGDAPCVFCGQPSDTADHIIPLRLGGVAVPGNLQPCCRSCNSRRRGHEDLPWGEQLAML